MRMVFVFALLATAVAPGFAFAQEQPEMELPNLKAPETLEEAGKGTLAVFDKMFGIFPGILGNIWNTQAVPLWRNMAEWSRQELWQKRLHPIAQNLIDRGKELLGREVEQRRPVIEQELEQEKQELAQDVAQYGKSAGKSLPRVKAGLWQRFLDLFREE